MPISEEKMVIRCTFKQIEGELKTFVKDVCREIPDAGRASLAKLERLCHELRGQMLAEIRSRSDRGSAQITSDIKRIRAGKKFEISGRLDDLIVAQFYRHHFEKPGPLRVAALATTSLLLLPLTGPFMIPLMMPYWVGYTGFPSRPRPGHLQVDEVTSMKNLLTAASEYYKVSLADCVFQRGEEQSPPEYGTLFPEGPIRSRSSEPFSSVQTSSQDFLGGEEQSPPEYGTLFPEGPIRSRSSEPFSSVQTSSQTFLGGEKPPPPAYNTLFPEGLIRTMSSELSPSVQTTLQGVPAGEIEAPLARDILPMASKSTAPLRILS